MRSVKIVDQTLKATKCHSCQERHRLIHAAEVAPAKRPKRLTVSAAVGGRSLADMFHHVEKYQSPFAASCPKNSSRRRSPGAWRIVVLHARPVETDSSSTNVDGDPHVRGE